MAKNKANEPKIVLIFKERKIVGITKNDPFFQYAELSRKKYFAKESDYLVDYIKDLKLEPIKKDTLFRDILIMSVANQSGYIGVDWERFFKQNVRALQNTTSATMGYLKQYYPHIIDMWDESISELSKKMNKQQKKDNSKGM